MIRAARDRLAAAATVVAVVVGACAPQPTNPSFPVEVREAEAMLRAMHDEPVELARPVVVVPGFMDFANAGPWLEWWLAYATGADRSSFVVVDLNGCVTFEACRARVFEAIDAQQPERTGADDVELDVVAFSMGGLVARYAAMPLDPATDPPSALPARRLRVKRLFTISSPHQGATKASAEAVMPLVRDMTAGSAFLERLDAALPDAGYELVPYVVVGDAIVGADRAAPADAAPYWLQPRPFAPAHLSAHRDPRILADMARRLRDEPPLAAGPPAPLPR